MNIANYFSEKNILVGLKASDKREVLEALVGLLDRNGLISNPRKLVAQLLDRESLGSTAIGQGIAFPHSQSAAAKAQAIAVGISKDGVPFGSLDGEPAHVFFLMVGPEGPNRDHLRTMSVISGFLREKGLAQKMKNVASPAELMALFSQDNHAGYC